MLIFVLAFSSIFLLMSPVSGHLWAQSAVFVSYQKALWITLLEMCCTNKVSLLCFVVCWVQTDRGFLNSAVLAVRTEHLSVRHCQVGCLNYKSYRATCFYWRWGSLSKDRIYRWIKDVIDDRNKMKQTDAIEGEEWGKNKPGIAGRKEGRNEVRDQERSRSRVGGRRGETWKEKVVRFYFGQDPIWSQVSSSQHQSSPVNHHPSGCWRSQRPGSKLCRSSDPSTHNSMSSPPEVREAAPTKPLQEESSMLEIYSTSSPGLHPVHLL